MGNADDDGADGDAMPLLNVGVGGLSAVIVCQREEDNDSGRVRELIYGGKS